MAWSILKLIASNVGLILGYLAASFILAVVISALGVGIDFGLTVWSLFLVGFFVAASVSIWRSIRRRHTVRSRCSS